MDPYSLTHVGNDALLRELSTGLAGDRSALAVRLAQLAEVDARRLYLSEGYSSMHAYCTRKLGFEDYAAFKRIRVARMARRFPAIYPAVANGRLHLSGLVLLAPFLTEARAIDLLQAAEGKTKAEIELLLALRFPQPDLPTLLEPVTGASSERAPLERRDSAIREGEFETLAPGPVDRTEPQDIREPDAEPIAQPPPPAPTIEPRVRVKPLAPQRYALQVTIAGSTREKLCRAQELLGHQLGSGDVASVLDRALDALIQQLERQKFAATSRPRRRRAARGPRTIPADVKREVWARDGGQCTFVSAAGHRCESRRALEFDHVREAARGGEATVANIRLRCRPHNQYTAERTYGAGFMRAKREAARRTSCAGAAVATAPSTTILMGRSRTATPLRTPRATAPARCASPPG